MKIYLLQFETYFMAKT